MNRKDLELAVNEINDSYIEEALTFKKASIIPLKRIASIAAVAIAVVIIGTISTVAVVRGRELKKVTVGTNTISVGTKPSHQDGITEETHDAIDLSNPDAIIYGDENTNWITKEIITRDYVNMEIFCYDDISKALADYKDPFYLDHVPGELKAVEVTKNFDGEWKFLDKYLFIQFFYAGGTVIIQDTNIDIDYYEIGFIGETTNAREYVNANGYTFTIVDDTGNESMSYVLVSSDNHSGYIWFMDMDDDHIHDVLDLISLN